MLAEKYGERKEKPLQLLDYLIDNCEILIERGHSSEYRNPYRYAIKDLIRLSDRARKMERQSLLSKIVAEHASRISVAAADSSPFQKVVESLTD